MADAMITKKIIANGLKELTKKKSFEKITIKDITEVCGLNRQSFYYHFQDKYDLVDWIYYNEAVSVIAENLSIDNWGNNILKMLNIIKEEKYFYEGTLKLTVENCFREHLFNITCELFSKLIMGSSNHEFDKDEKFVIEFYAYGIIGTIIHWIQSGMKESPEYICDQLQNVYNSTEKYIVKRVKESMTD